MDSEKMAAALTTLQALAHRIIGGDVAPADEVMFEFRKAWVDLGLALFDTDEDKMLEALKILTGKA